MKRLVLLALLIALPACSLFDEEEGPGKLPLGELRSAPASVSLGMQVLLLRTFLWREFEPNEASSGKPLAAIVWVYSADSTALPAGLTVDALWIINEGRIWDTFLNERNAPPEERQPYQLTLEAGGGPKWGPHIPVDAVIRLRSTDGTAYLLRAPNQIIELTF